MYKRIVVKVGTKVLTKSDGSLNQGYLVTLVLQIVELRKHGTEVILVTSGAVAAGKEVLSIADKPDVVQKQIYAAVGQVKLMNAYADLFEKFGYHSAQVLVSKEDFRDSEHYTNMKRCFEGLLLDNVIPVVNENDVVATTELMFTDNDELAGLVAKQISADALIILTSTNGILDRKGDTISKLGPGDKIYAEEQLTADVSTGGRGGMASKVTTAFDLVNAGLSSIQNENTSTCCICTRTWSLGV